MENTDNIEKIDLSRVDWKSSREFFESLGEALDKLDDKDESYNFTWVGKRKSIIEAGAPINKTLRPDVESSKNFDDTKNMLIVGDNLDALKLLQESYLGKIKMIYIDPPYNHDLDQIYHDNYTINKADYKDSSQDMTGAIVVSEDQLFENSKANGRFHSDWLSMMYPRLKLSRNLLTDDGIIIISIDDGEQANLKKMCDELFGENNFIAQIIVDGTPKNDPYIVATSHEYALVYCKNFDTIKNSNYGLTSPAYSDLVNIYNTYKPNYERVVENLLKYYKDNGLCDDNISNYKYADENGIFRIGPIDDPQQSGPKDTRINPITNEPCRTPNGGWRCNLSTWNQWLKDNLIFFPLDANKLPAKKTYITSDRLDVMKSYYKVQTRKDSDYLKKLFGTDTTPFPNPKPLSLLSMFIKNCNSDGIYLDFFSGSGSFGEAVIRSNLEDSKERRYICVQYPEKITTKGKSGKQKKIAESAIAFLDKNKRPREISELTISRLTLFESQLAPHDKKIDVGFRVFRIDSNNENEDIRKPLNQIGQSDLFNAIDNIKNDRTPLDLLFGVVYVSALPLDLKLETRKIGDNTVYLYGYLDEGSGLVACFDDNISEETIKEIAKLNPLTAAFKDSSFADSAAKINLSEQFRVIAPDTKVKVI